MLAYLFQHGVPISIKCETKSQGDCSSSEAQIVSLQADKGCSPKWDPLWVVLSYLVVLVYFIQTSYIKIRIINRIITLVDSSELSILIVDHIEKIVKHVDCSVHCTSPLPVAILAVLLPLIVKFIKAQEFPCPNSKHLSFSESYKLLRTHSCFSWSFNSSGFWTYSFAALKASKTAS